ncbi:hypothetical protein VIGAN_04244900 [Vigna angularis var. angularis]|uniref:Uncharacterized protein n=2 Tax=Vigna TaxID=3913 RepID=A0A0S3RWI7_PHAAN|nr:hypothetical protein VIGAN_04244900 [Vigna angularis var. angularis]
MKNTLINRPIVTRKLIQDATRSGIPDVNHSIRTTSRYLASIRRPTTLQQVLLKVVLVPFQHLHTAILWSIWAHVPNAKLAIHAICKKVRPIRTQLHTSNHILMTLQCHGNFTFTQIPNLDIIINTTGEDLI